MTACVALVRTSPASPDAATPRVRGVSRSQGTRRWGLVPSWAKELKIGVPCAEGRLAAHEVSSLINSPRNNAPELLEPVGDALR